MPGTLLLGGRHRPWSTRVHTPVHPGLLRCSCRAHLRKGCGIQHQLKKNFFFFISFWLCWVFVAACRLSLVAAGGSCSLVVHGLVTVVVSHCGAQASGVLSHRLSCPKACEVFSRTGIKPVSLVLVGGFLTTGPLGKPPGSAFEDITKAVLPAQCPAWHA